MEELAEDSSQHRRRCGHHHAHPRQRADVQRRADPRPYPTDSLRGAAERDHQQVYLAADVQHSAADRGHVPQCGVRYRAVYSNPATDHDQRRRQPVPDGHRHDREPRHRHDHAACWQLPVCRLRHEQAAQFRADFQGVYPVYRHADDCAAADYLCRTDFDGTDLVDQRKRDLSFQ